MGEVFDPYYSWLAIPVGEQPPHHYRLLGVTLFEANGDVIANAADQRMAFLRTMCAGPKGALSQRLLNEIAAARLTLLDAKRRAVYDEALRAELDAARVAAPPVPPPPVAPPISLFPLGAPVEVKTLSSELSPRPLPAGGSRKPVRPAASHYPALLAAGAAALVAAGLVVLASRDQSAPDRIARDTGAPPAGAADQTGAASPHQTASAQVGAAGADDKNHGANGELGGARRRAEPAAGAARPTDASVELRESAAVAAEPEMPDRVRKPASEEAAGSASGEPPIAEPPVAAQRPAAATVEKKPRTPTPAPTPAAEDIDRDGEREKLHEPSAESLAAASAQIKTIFHSDLVAAVRPDSKRALAQTLLHQAGETRNEPATRFELYHRARQLAAEAGDMMLASTALESLAEAFQVDAPALGLQTLQQLAKVAKTADDRAAVARTALESVAPAAAENELAVADKLATLAQAEATKARDADTRKKATARLVELKKLEQEWKDVRPAIAALEADPDDAAASAKYGRYLCLVRGDWTRGLPLLARSAEGKLSAAARQDLDRPDDGASQAQLADAWWDLAGDEKGSAKMLTLERSLYWYRLALPQAAGLSQTRIERRVQEISSRLGEEPLGRISAANVGPKFLDLALNADTSLRLRWLTAGKFIEGSPSSEPGHQPYETQHEVVLTRPFAIGVTEVTQAQWSAVMGSNPSRFTGDDLPVQNVSYGDALEFCQRLSQLPSVRGAQRFRLPTSAEWEYACRAGSRGAYCFGNDPALLGQYAWYQTTTAGAGGPRPVAQLKPNAAGLYDMHGNVNEWCDDRFDTNAFSTRQVDPHGFSGDNQVVRGGYGMSTAEQCRSAHRFNDPPTRSVDGLGFRVVGEAIDPAPTGKSAR